VSIITLTTDFGADSPYVAAMKGVILTINPAARIVDITHSVPPQDVRQGALVLDEASRWFPEDTIHVAVVDPGVGTSRAILYARIGRQQFIAPDNGLLSRLVVRTPPSKTIRLVETGYWLPNVSTTFHGRDIMAPVAARLSLGLSPDQLGPPVERFTVLEWPAVRVSPGRIEGQIVEIDSFGNLLTNIASDLLAGRPTDTRVCVVSGIYETWGIFGSYAMQADGSLIAVVGSSGRVELAITGDNAAARLGLTLGTPVVIAWD
jgi:S-adenosyl-L-methionine hydrolase (adenosine-forming)